MPAISRRRGSAARFGRGVGSAAFCSAALCSGGNLSTGSAIALFFPWWFAGRILDRVANVFLDRFQLREQAVSVGGIDAFERGRGEFRAQAPQFAKQRPRRLAQIQAIDAAVAVVAAALDPAIVAKL